MRRSHTQEGRDDITRRRATGGQALTDHQGDDGECVKMLLLAQPSQGGDKNKSVISPRCASGTYRRVSVQKQELQGHRTIGHLVDVDGMEASKFT